MKYLNYLFVVVFCTCVTSVAMESKEESDEDISSNQERPTLNFGPKGAVVTSFETSESENEKYVKRENSLLWMELSGDYFQDPALLSQKLEEAGVKAGRSKLLLVDMDKTLADANVRYGKGQGEQWDCMGPWWSPPNFALIELIKNALTQEAAFVALVTMNVNHPSILRDFLSHHLPHEHHVIPIIFAAHHSEFNNPKTFSLKPFFRSFFEDYHKNIHAMLAVKTFAPFFGKNKLKVGMVDDSREILVAFKQNGIKHIAQLDPGLEIAEVVTFFPGNFITTYEGNNRYIGEWKNTEQPMRMISRFLFPYRSFF